jgi:hypothetical protein
MGSGFGIDGERTIKNNSRRVKRKSAFRNRGKNAPNISLRFSSEGALSKSELQALGLKQKHSERYNLLKKLFITLFIIALLISISTLIINL